MIPANRQRNYLQSALYVIIAGILAAVLLERLLTYAEAAEKATMEATLSQLQAGLYARLAYLVLKGEYESVEALPSQSPFVAANARSSHYLGEFDAVPGNVEGGRWLFNRGRDELVYVPNLTRYLTIDQGGWPPGVLRFRLEVIKASTSTYTGVALRPVVAYQWSPAP